MALKDLLNLSNNNKKIGLSEERVRAIIPVARQYVAFWREYPDMFIDFCRLVEMKLGKKKLTFIFTREFSCGPPCDISMYTWYSPVLILNHFFL